VTQGDPFIDLIDGWRYRFLAGEFAFVGEGAAASLVTLQRLLCDATARLNRWGGWSKDPVPVARHTLLVCAFTLARAEGLGWPEEQIDATVREAAAHDLHEPLGLGDVLSPVLRWLRETCPEPVDGLIALGERAVRRLFDIMPQDDRAADARREIARIVKLADHDAAAVERGYACNDAPAWLGPRVALARHAIGQHSMSDGVLGLRLWKVLTGGAAAMHKETDTGFVQDWLLRRLGFGTPESRARLVELTGVPS